MKKNCRLLELEQTVVPDPVYDESFGEQLALNADGVMRDKRDPKDNYFQRYLLHIFFNEKILEKIFF